MEEVPAPLKFYRLNGELVPGDFQGLAGVAAARAAVAQALEVLPCQVKLVAGCTLLEDGAPLPGEGCLQVEVQLPPEGSWARLLYEAASPLDEEALREALERSWPGEPRDTDFDSCEGIWRSSEPATYWDLDHKWMQFTSRKLWRAVTETLGTWANVPAFAEKADTYGYWMVEPPRRSKSKTVEEMLAAVKRWKEIILEMEEDFKALRARTEGMNLAESLEIAAAQLLRYSSRFMSVETPFKYGFETWYQQFHIVMEWYADSAGMDMQAIGPLLETVIFNRDGFASYTVKANAAAFLGTNVARAVWVEFEAMDSTARWIEIRRSAFSSSVGVESADVCNQDMHFQFIGIVDHGRAPRRAACMRAALKACRESAARKEPLTFELMQQWQMMVLGRAGGDVRQVARFRDTDAYAKAGRERYPFDKGDDKRKGTQALFEERLANASAHKVAAPVRAARAYLDVCFFHPFDDGNSRAARLVLDFVLARAGLCLRQDPALLFTTPKRADDELGASAFAEMVASMVAKIGPDHGADLATWAKEGKELDDPKDPGRPPRGPARWFDCLTDEYYDNIDRE